MYALIASIDVKAEFRDRFIEESKLDAQGSVRDEPGCSRFDIIQDPENPNRLWLYEVYFNEDGFKAHGQTPHLKRWLETRDWWDGPPTLWVKGGTNIWPSDDEWQSPKS